VASGVVIYKHDDSITRWWYALPVEALNDKSDVRKLLINPLVSHLEGMSLKDSSRSLSSYLLRFQVADDRVEPCGTARPG